MFLENLILSITGLLLGSFVGVCVFRMPRGESVIRGRSHCDFCNALLPWRYKLPVIGFVLLRGRSRCCHEKIPLRYTILELGMGLATLFIFRMGLTANQAVTLIFFLGFLVTGMLIDFKHRIIPDAVTLSGIAAAMVLAVVSHNFSFIELGLGIVLCGGYLYIGALLGEHLLRTPQAMGGGDIKFAAMIGAFLGVKLGAIAVLSGALLACIFGLVKLTRDPQFRASRAMPFGPFLALGAGVAVIWGRQIISWYLSNFWYNPL